MQHWTALDELDDGRRRAAGRWSGIDKKVDELAERSGDFVGRHRRWPARQIGAVMHAPNAADSERATRCAGTRTPTVPYGVSAAAIPRAAATTIVNGPGQNADASRRSSGPKPSAATCSAIVASAAISAIAHAFHTLMIEEIPVLGPEQRNEARRLITLMCFMTMAWG